MIGKKKKSYLVKFEINMDASQCDKTIVKATKPSVAVKIAEEKLMKEKSYSHMKVLYCIEV